MRWWMINLPLSMRVPKEEAQKVETSFKTFQFNQKERFSEDNVLLQAKGHIYTQISAISHLNSFNCSKANERKTISIICFLEAVLHPWNQYGANTFRWFVPCINGISFDKNWVSVTFLHTKCEKKSIEFLASLDDICQRSGERSCAKLHETQFCEWDIMNGLQTHFPVVLDAKSTLVCRKHELRFDYY